MTTSVQKVFGRVTKYASEFGQMKLTWQEIFCLRTEKFSRLNIPF